MKTTNVIALCVLAASLSLSAFGQGLIQFNNRVTTTLPAVDAPIFHGGVLSSGTDQTLRVALLGRACQQDPGGRVWGWNAQHAGQSQHIRDLGHISDRGPGTSSNLHSGGATQSANQNSGERTRS